MSQWRQLVPGFHSRSAGATCCVDDARNVIRIDSADVDDAQLPSGSIAIGLTETDASTEGFFTAARNVCGNDSGLIVIVYPVILPGGCCDRVTVVFSTQDSLLQPCSQPGVTWLDLPWPAALDRLGFSAEEKSERGLWSDQEVGENSRCLWTARLFPCSRSDGRRISMKEAAATVDIAMVLSERRLLHKKIVSWCLMTGAQLPGNSKYLRLFDLSVKEGWSRDLLAALDSAAMRLAAIGAGAERSSQLARILAMTADLLGSMAAGLGGLRSGPARNPAFGAGLRMLEAGQLAEGLAAWSSVRDEGGWLDTAARLVRAARHYEGGVQLLIRQTVMSAQAQVRVNLDLLADQTDRRPPLGVPVIVRCPARLDLSGGWTDTPPICYELGGQVVDLAITLDGVKPIGCRAVRIPELRVEIVLPGGGGDDEDPTEKEVLLQICSLTDMADHCNPVARGALVKCCLLAAGLIRLGEEEDKTTVTLASQLEQRLGSGLRLELWSDLPQGSGLGTSSILAGAVVAACWTAASATYTRSDLVHAVLVVEQLLTTGGGWQDQVGGLHSGLSLGTSRPDRQVVVTTQHWDASEQFLAALGKSEHLGVFKKKTV